MEEMEKIINSMEELVSTLDAQLKSANVKLNAMKNMIAEKEDGNAAVISIAESRVWSVGDVILSDGTIIDAANIGDADEEDLEKADMIVCAVKNGGRKAYGLMAKDPISEVSQLDDIKKDAGTEKYPDGWIVPGIIMLREIYENQDEINEILEYVSAPELSGEVYSKTPDSDYDYKYIDFDSGTEGSGDDSTRTIPIHAV